MTDEKGKSGPVALQWDLYAHGERVKRGAALSFHPDTITAAFCVADTLQHQPQVSEKYLHPAGPTEGMSLFVWDASGIQAVEEIIRQYPACPGFLIEGMEGDPLHSACQEIISSANKEVVDYGAEIVDKPDRIKLPKPSSIHAVYDATIETTPETTGALKNTRSPETVAVPLMARLAL